MGSIKMPITFLTEASCGPLPSKGPKYSETLAIDPKNKVDLHGKANSSILQRLMFFVFTLALEPVIVSCICSI